MIYLLHYRNMLFGYDQGVMGSLLTGPSFEGMFPSISNGNTTLQGFTVSGKSPKALVIPALKEHHFDAHRSLFTN